jgi:hypothetical protein
MNYFFIPHFQFFHSFKFRNELAEWPVLAKMVSAECRTCAPWLGGPDNDPFSVQDLTHSDQNRIV